MSKPTLNHHGFHVLPLIVIVLVVGLIGLVGFRVFHLQGNSTTEGQAVPAPNAVQTAPGGWKVYASTSLGAQFIYPDIYGVFSEQPVTDPFENVLATNRLTSNYLPGVAGNFSLKTYKKLDAEIQTRRYGPKVKLDRNEWMVTTPNEADAKTYKKGDPYPEMTRTNTHGLEVYSAEAGDEGIVSYSLYFVTQDKLHVLELPPFDSEQYTTTYNINDRAPYDAMFAQVRDSIRLY